jgi:predicted secreted hydrolase
MQQRRRFSQVNRSSGGFVMRRGVFLIFLLLLSSCSSAAAPVSSAIGAVAAVNAGNSADFAQAVRVRPFSFPADHAAHPEFQTEWWYFTGNLRSSDGRRFGYQLTLFRRALAAQPVERASAWGADQIYMGHLAVSDIDGGRFHAAERFSRAALGLAGVSAGPLTIALHDWQLQASGPEGMTWQLTAADGPIALNLRAENLRPPVLQGDRGLSQKGSAVGNASYYYSLTRMATSGTVTVDGETFSVEGLSWMDREWGSSALEAGVAGWDWFALHLDSGHDLMYFQLRNADGTPSPFTGGSLLAPDGTLVQLDGSSVTLEVLERWDSPRSAAQYPIAWRLQSPQHGLDLTLRAAMPDQELPVSIVYWEGSIAISGSHSGRGYMELTGYAEAGEGRFAR